MFESGPGGDFSTYVGEATGAIYWLDLAKVHHQGASVESFLSSAEKREGSLRHVPKELRCKICGTVFSALSIPIDGEEFIDANEL